MIKKIIINYPFLQLEREFKKGLNIIEEDNGYGKTTILNTIQSVFTFKYPNMRTLPEGSATIETDKDKFILSKKNWIGTTTEQNDLYNYIVPGKFFELKSTTDQRKVLIDLLDLDYNTFMKAECDKAVDQFPYLVWSEDLEKNLKDKMKEFETNEVLILQDINRLKSELINFDVKNFDDIKKYNEDKEKILEAIKEYNKGIIDRQNKYNSLVSSKNNFNIKIDSNINEIQRLTDSNISLDKQLEQLRIEYSNTDSKALCDKCLSELHGNKKQIVLDGLSQAANKIKDQKFSNEKTIKDLLNGKEQLIKELDKVNKEIDSFNIDFTIMSYDDLISAGIKFGIDITITPKERLEEYEEYKSSLSKKQRTEEELKYKEDSLKAINTLLLQSSIDKFKEIKSMFTSKLEEATKSLPLDIQLFETLKNGNIKETFTIKYKGTDYYDLSTGNKGIVNIMLAKLFIDKLGMDILLIDEGGLISKSNLDYIKELANDYQVIICKATSWSLKNLK